MDEDGFFNFMKTTRKPSNTIKFYNKQVKRFESYLNDNKNGLELNEIKAGDLRDYVIWCSKNERNAYQELTAIKYYYRFLKSEDLSFECDLLSQEIQLAKLKLKDFLAVDQEYAKKLAKIGIKTANQILEIGRTENERKILAEKSKVPVDEILKFVKLSDLARSPGLKKIRASLYFEAGLDTFDKIAEQKPEEMVAYLEKYINKTGFEGTAPLLADATGTVEIAKKIPRIIK